MATIVLGRGTAHSPLVSEPPEFCSVHGASKKQNPRMVAAAYGRGDWAELSRQKAAWIYQEITPEKFRARYAAAQAGVAALRATLERVKPDVLVVVGDDQDDVFLHEALMPAIGI